jgi:predicted RNA-binding Zn-ribbon protein involved in translation (DUF1610 family)
MQATCTHCGKQHVLKDSEIAGHTRVQFRCTKCGQPTVVEVAKSVDQTMVISPLPSFARAGSASTARVPVADDGLKLPEKLRVVLNVISGPGQGGAFVLPKARVTLGRQGSDIALNDPEISRYHCLLEVRDGYINLKDMDSTNGTFLEEERVRAAMLHDGSEFKIGNTVLRVTFQPK